MAHELTVRRNGSIEMAYVGNTPWHGLGNKLESGLSIEEWIAAAGMDWRIRRAKVRYAVSHSGASDPNAYRVFDGKVVLHRSDTLDPLGVVSEDYKVVQPQEILEFFRDLTEAAGFELETAGTLFGGKRFWGLAKIGSEASIADSRDKVGGYLLLSTACDGSMATEARYTTVRVVCNNTLGFARSKKECTKVSHRTQFDADAVKAELGIDNARSRFNDAMAQFRALAETRVKPADMVDLTVKLLKPEFSTLDDKAQDKILRSQPVQAIGNLAMGGAMGSDLDGAQGTAWAWLNAVTEYVDHKARAQSVDNRLNSAWFGKGEQVKERALELAMATVNGGTSYSTTYAPSDEPSSDSSLLDAVLDATNS